ncbi:unnamed protein product [Cuscuta europaea]|uniref:U1 small nuclear ribonucleoprotein C n=1 Tax=Cuscuta europaea TaxID=41803 RepID=A0A9P0ZFR2_CUSEU|nr:unnamed protein product [Cuscuta europaea]
MPRYYCDYCDTYLTHDSPSVRKQHNAGYKHKANVRIYYQKFEEQLTQAFIDQRIKERLGQAAAYQQIGAAYNQHLATFPGQAPRMPIMPPHLLPIPGAQSPQLVPGVRPPILPRPLPGAPAYAVPPMLAPVPGHPPGAPSGAPPLHMQPPSSGVPNSSSAPPLPGGVALTTSSSSAPAPPQATYPAMADPTISAAPATNPPPSSTYTFAPAPASVPETSN